MKFSTLFFALFVVLTVTVSADESVCPCRCLRGVARRRRATNQCNRPDRIGVCEVTPCALPGGRRSFQCCDVPPTPEPPTPTPEPPTPTPEPPTPTPEPPTPTPMPPLECPCICRFGRPGRRRARRMCRRNPGCVVTMEGCSGPRRFQCCNPPASA